MRTADGSIIRGCLDGDSAAFSFLVGNYRAAHWNGGNEEGELVASGVYFYAFEAGEFRRT